MASCDDLNPHWSKQEQEYALNAIMALSNLNAHFGDTLRASDVANIAMAVGKENLVETFTYSDEFDEYEDHWVHAKSMTTKSWMYMINIVSALNTFLIAQLEAIPVVGDQVSLPFKDAQATWQLIFSMYLYDGTRDGRKLDSNT